MTSVSIADDGSYLSLNLPDGPSRFHAMWLRDNSRDPKTRAPGNDQRLIRLTDIPADTCLTDARVDGDTLSCTFSPEDKTISYGIDWLAARAYDGGQSREKGRLPANAEAWDAGLNSNVPTGHFPDISSNPAALQDWLTLIRRYGFAKVTGLPVESGNLFKIVDLFGYVRETNYGRHFEVRTEVNPVNLAFTGMGLQAHTDNPYRDPVPSIQVLSCLENSADGGESMLVDGFACVQRLQAEDPHGFDLLSRYSAKFEYAGENGVCLQSNRPMIELSPEGWLVSLRFNSRSISAITEVPFDDMTAYYAAYRRLSEIIDDTAMEVTFKMEAGEAMVFDNTRILHARKEFSGEGNRWLQGCYSDKDGLLSKLAAMEVET